MAIAVGLDRLQVGNQLGVDVSEKRQRQVDRIDARDAAAAGALRLQRPGVQRCSVLRRRPQREEQALLLRYLTYRRSVRG
jgi:hypothetical protein